MLSPKVISNTGNCRLAHCVQKLYDGVGELDIQFFQPVAQFAGVGPNFSE
jgi:hypothetical protein